MIFTQRHPKKKKAQKTLYFLRKLKRAILHSQIPINLKRAALESILTGDITNGIIYAIQDRTALQRVIKITQNMPYNPVMSAKMNAIFLFYFLPFLAAL